MFQPNLHFGIINSFYFRADVKKQNSLHVKSKKIRNHGQLLHFQNPLSCSHRKVWTRRVQQLSQLLGSTSGACLPVFRHSFWFNGFCIVCCILISHNDLTSEHVIVCHGNLL